MKERINTLFIHEDCGNDKEIYKPMLNVQTNRAEKKSETQDIAVEVSSTTAFYDGLKMHVYRPSADIYQWLSDKAIKCWRYGTKLLAILTTLMVLFTSAKGIFQVNYTIVPFDVPVMFSDSGINGNFVVWHLSDNIAATQKSGWSIDGLHIKSGLDNMLDKDVVLFGVSLNAVKSLVRHTLGISDKSISGSLIYQQDRLLMRLAISDSDSIIITKNVRDFEDIYMAYDALIDTATREVLKVIDPFVLVSHYWSEKQPNKSIELIQQMIQDKNSSADSAYLIWGKILEEKGQQEEAIAKFNESLKLNPEQYLSRYNICVILYRQGRYSEAINECQKSLSVNAEHGDAYYIWAKALSKQGHHKKSITQFRRAIEIDPNQYLSYNEISYEFQAIGDLFNAIQFLQKGIELLPENGALHATLSEMYWFNNAQEESFKHILLAIDLGFNILPHIASEPYKSYHTSLKDSVL